MYLQALTRNGLRDLLREFLQAIKERARFINEFDLLVIAIQECPANEKRVIVIADMLLQFGADVNKGKAMSPLQAVMERKDETVFLLLKALVGKGADLVGACIPHPLKKDTLVTALWWAVRKQNHFAVQALLETDEIRKIEHIQEYITPEILKKSLELSDHETARCLLKHGADVLHNDHEALKYVFSVNRDLGLMELLLEAEAKIDCQGLAKRCTEMMQIYIETVSDAWTEPTELFFLLLRYGAQHLGANARETISDPNFEKYKRWLDIHFDGVVTAQAYHALCCEEADQYRADVPMKSGDGLRRTNSKLPSFSRSRGLSLSEKFRTIFKPTGKMTSEDVAIN